MPDTHYAKRRQRPAAPPKAYVMISYSLGRRADFSLPFRAAGRSTPTMSADRSTPSCRAILFLLASLVIPSVARPATLEDSAKELARKIAAVLPSGENASCEIRNLSSLQSGDVARIDQALKAELQQRGIVLKSGGAEVGVVVTLSENFRNLIWTGEIRRGDASQVVLVAAERSPENHAFSRAMPVTIRGEKYWEGPERILDAGEVSNGAGKSWLILLFKDGLQIQDRQTGLVTTLDIASQQSASRDPWGNLNFDPIGNTVRFFLSPRVCTVNLESPDLSGCLQAEGSTGGPSPGSFPVMFDIAPPGPPSPGKGTVIEIRSGCGTNQFLATGARDYTQTDSLQVFQGEPDGAVAVSSEVDFPGPITALHSVSEKPRAVVRNLTTGNYEAYRLAISCGQ